MRALNRPVARFPRCHLAVERFDEHVGAEDDDGRAEAGQHLPDVVLALQPGVLAPFVVRLGEHDAALVVETAIEIANLHQGNGKRIGE